MRVSKVLFFAAILTVLPAGSAQTQSGHAVHAPVQSGRISTRVSAPFARPVTPNLGGRPYSIRRDIPTPIGLNPPAASYTGILPGAYPQGGGNTRRNNRGTAAFVGGPIYLPFIGADTSFGDYPSYDETADVNAQAFAATQEAMAEQLRQLSADLESVKRQQALGPALEAPIAAPETAAPQPPVSVILKSGQQLTVQSYAVMNGFFWDFTKQPVRKIPLSNIDLPASAKATEANGAEFPQITSSRN